MHRLIRETDTETDTETKKSRPTKSIQTAWADN